MKYFYLLTGVALLTSSSVLAADLSVTGSVSRYRCRTELASGVRTPRPHLNCAPTRNREMVRTGSSGKQSAVARSRSRSRESFAGDRSALRISDETSIGQNDR